MYNKEAPSDKWAGRLALLLFVFFLLMMYSQWWRTQTETLGWAAVPLTPWAVSGALVLLVWGAVAYYIGLLGLRKLYKCMIGLPIAIALLTVAEYLRFFFLAKKMISGDFPDGFFGVALIILLFAYYALYAMLYIPLAGLVRLIPSLSIRMTNTRYFPPVDPMATVVICLFYLSLSISFYTLGKKLRDKAQESAPPEEPVQ